MPRASADDSAYAASLSAQLLYVCMYGVRVLRQARMGPVSVMVCMYLYCTLIMNNKLLKGNRVIPTIGVVRVEFQNSRFFTGPYPFSRFPVRPKNFFLA